MVEILTNFTRVSNCLVGTPNQSSQAQRKVEQWSGAASATTSASGVMAGLVIGMTAGTGLRTEALAMSENRRRTAYFTVAGWA